MFLLQKHLQGLEEDKPKVVFRDWGEGAAGEIKQEWNFT